MPGGESKRPARGGHGHGRGPAGSSRGRRPNRSTGKPPKNRRGDERRDAPLDIPADVQARDLPFSVRVELKSLTMERADEVARLLIMVMVLLPEEPAAALDYAKAAVERASRIGVVREFCGLAAYRSGDYALALRELRTHRRITGHADHVPEIADALRGMGRPDEAIREVREVDSLALEPQVRSELAIVAAGAQMDRGDREAAVAELAPLAEHDPDTAYAYSARLFEAYADALTAVGRDADAAIWRRRAEAAERAWAPHRQAAEAPDGFMVTDLGEIAER